MLLVLVMAGLARYEHLAPEVVDLVLSERLVDPMQFLGQI